MEKNWWECTKKVLLHAPNNFQFGQRLSTNFFPPILSCQFFPANSFPPILLLLSRQFIQRQFLPTKKNIHPISKFLISYLGIVMFGVSVCAQHGQIEYASFKYFNFGYSASPFEQSRKCVAKI
jgi:hypothetical protein